MAQFNPYNQYNDVTFGTADPGKLVVQSYDAVIRSLKEVIRAMNENDYESRVKHVDIAFGLLSELRKSLKPEHDEQFTGKLSALYEFFTREIVTSNAYSDPDRLKPIIKMLKDLRDAWETARKTK